MGFRARLDEEAAKTLMNLPAPVRHHVAMEIRRLAENPAGLSRRADFPHPRDGQLFETKCSVGQTEHFATIMFKYSADEIHIDVVWIVHRQRPSTDLPPLDFDV